MNAYPVTVDALLSALSSTKRRELLAALTRSPMSVSELQKLLGYAMSDISRHLSELRACGLIISEIHKKEHIQRLARHAHIDLKSGSISIEIDGDEPFHHVILKHELHSSALRSIASAA